MEIDSAELRRHYSQLSDEELLALDCDDLTAAARNYVEQECSRRGLARSAAPAFPRTSQMRPCSHSTAPISPPRRETTSSRNARAAASLAPPSRTRPRCPSPIRSARAAPSGVT